MEILPDGDSVSVIKVDYEPGAGSSAGMHKWYYYFNPENGALVANFLDYRDGYSYTEYAGFEVVDGIKLSKKRISYSTNANKKKEPGTTVYVNDEIKFNEELPEDLFSFD